jgi:hypothetical protein
MKLILIGALVLLAIGLVLACLFYLIHPRLLFYPEKLPADYSFSFSEPFTEVVLKTDRTASIHALHFQLSAPSGVVLYFHGNAGSLRSWGTLAPDFLSHNYDLFIIDYRSYGKSTGELSEKALLTDAQACYDYLKNKYKPLSIIVYGRSIGTGPAAYVASRNRIGSLALETPYYSMPHLIQSYVPWLPISWLVRYKLRTATWAKKATCPVYLIHGTKDKIIPFASSVKIQKEVPGAQLFRVEGGMHNNLSTFSMYDVFLDSVLE